MITLQQVLNSQSTLLEGKRIKLVRHKDTRREHRAEYREVIKDRATLLEYQQKQGRNVFDKCEYLVSFTGLDHGRSLFLGVFKVNGCKFKDGHYWYDLQQVDVFNSLVDRLVIDWGRGSQAWVQWYHSREKEVLEILPEGSIGDFKGLQNFVLECRELQRLVQHKKANREWMNHLSSVKGIYLILDEKEGKQYIGSAYGEQGIWQRWSEYAKNPSGDNKLLKQLLEKEKCGCCRCTSRCGGTADGHALRWAMTLKSVS